MDIIASGVTDLYTPHAKVHKSASNVITINIVDDTVQYSTVPNNNQWPFDINLSNLEPLFEKPTRLDYQTPKLAMVKVFNLYSQTKANSLLFVKQSTL